MVTPASNHNYNKHNPHKNDGFSEIRKIIRLVLRNWYLFVISMILCLGFVEFYHRYTPQVYRASVTMLFKNNPERTLSQTSLMEGFGLSPEMRSVENQTFIIRSNKMVRKAVDKLDFGISYFVKGRLKDTELYGSLPFNIIIDSIHPQILNTLINLKFTSNGKVRVNINTENATLHNFALSSNVGTSGPINLDTTIAIGEKLNHSAFSFLVNLEQTPGADLFSNEYFVIFNSHSNITSRFRESLTVSNYREGSSIIFISTRGEQPQKIVRFLDVFSEVIIVNNLERKNDMANRSLEFIQKQLGQISDTLKVMQQRLMDFRQNNRFMIPSEMSQKLSAEFFEKEKELMKIDLSRDYFQVLKKMLINNQIDENDYLMPAFASDNAGLTRQLVLEHMALLNELSLLEGAGKVNPYNKELTKKLGLSKENLIIVIDKQLETIALQKKEVDRLLEGLSAKIGDLPALERDYLALERTYKLNDAIYTFLLQKNSETQITKASNIPDNEILDQASLSGIITPNKRSNFSKAFLIGLVIPALLIAIKEFFNVKIRGKDDLDVLGFDVSLVGSIIHSKEKSENVVMENSMSAIAESFRSLRARLRFLMGQANGNVISITSTNTGEGKTFCAINLAAVFAISGKKTLLVGFDMRKPRLSGVFGLGNQPGISGFLIGQVELGEIIQSTVKENLFVLPAGIVPPNPSELILSTKTVELFSYLRKNFDIIIIDTPPVGLVSDARILMDLSDCHLYIVRAGVTNREHFTLTLSNLINEEIPCLGLVLNDVNPTHNGYGYSSSGYYSPQINNKG